MKLALAVSAFTTNEPASTIRNNDQGPMRSSTDGAPVSLLTEIAVRGAGPGHRTVVGELLCGCGGGGGVGCGPPNKDDVAGPGMVGLAIVVPPISVLTVTPGPGAPGGRIAKETAGTPPPVWKNASRI